MSDATVHLYDAAGSVLLESTGAPSHEAATGVRFRAMVDANIAFIARTLRRLGVPALEVEDAVQRVFLTAHARLGKIGPGKDRTYLIGICLRVASRARRSAQRREGVLVRLFGQSIEPIPNPEDMILEAERRAHLDRLLDTLPDRLRAAFVLFELEELSSSEVAVLLDIPTGTVASRVRRARGILHKRFNTRVEVGHG